MVGVCSDHDELLYFVLMKMSTFQERPCIIQFIFWRICLNQIILSISEIGFEFDLMRNHMEDSAV